MSNSLLTTIGLWVFLKFGYFFFKLSGNTGLFLTFDVFFSGASDDATSDSGSSLADADDDLAASRSSLDLSEHETQRESD